MFNSEYFLLLNKSLMNLDKGMYERCVGELCKQFSCFDVDVAYQDILSKINSNKRMYSRGWSLIPPYGYYEPSVTSELCSNASRGRLVKKTSKYSYAYDYNEKNELVLIQCMTPEQEVYTFTLCDITQSTHKFLTYQVVTDEMRERFGYSKNIKLRFAAIAVHNDQGLLENYIDISFSETPSSFKITGVKMDTFMEDDIEEENLLSIEAISELKNDGKFPIHICLRSVLRNEKGKLVDCWDEKKARIEF